MNTPDYTADHLQYLVERGWTMSTDVISYHLLTQPGSYIIMQPSGTMYLFRWNESWVGYKMSGHYHDTRVLPLHKFDAIAKIMGLVADNSLGGMVN